MRCKNCGSENEENLYICQNCGSPLYDEDEQVDSGETPMDEIGATKVVPIVNENQNNQNPQPSYPQQPKKDEEEEKKKKQTTAIIIVLVVVLVLVIGILAGVLIHKNSTKDTTTTVATSVTETTTATTTQKETTTKPTTTTTTTTTTQTTAQSYTVSAVCTGAGGSVDGSGSYNANDKCTVTATPDPGYKFKGWYVNGKLKSSSASYTFTVTSNIELEATFEEDTAQE